MASWKARPTRVGDNNLPRRADILVRHSENDLVDFEWPLSESKYLYLGFNELLIILQLPYQVRSSYFRKAMIFK